MGGKLTSAILRPWGETWQLWRSGKKRSGWELDQETELAGIKAPPDAVCAVPARLMVALPLWIEAEEDAMVREMVQLEAEMKGLTSAERFATDAEVNILRRDEKRCLALATIAPAEWPPELASLRGEAYAPSPALAALADNTIHLWREQDDLVAAVVWRGSLVCWETLHFTTEAKEVEGWLRRFLLQLQNDLGLDDPLRLKQWVGIFPEPPLGLMGDATLTDSDRREGPPLRAELVRHGQWLPGPMRELRKARERRQLLTRIAAGLLLAAGLLAAVGGSMAYSLQTKLNQADAELIALEKTTSPLRDIAQRWVQIEPSADHRFFPLEMLHLVVSSMPSSDIRLTVFEMSPEKILVEGEAANVSAATEFFQKLQASPDASGVAWEMPSPSLQPNNTARFLINGARNDDQ